MRKHYIDNLRSLAILILIPYHAAMAWNSWREPNYMMFGSSRILSSIIVAFSPFLMPLLFLLAGMSTRFALNKRTAVQYVTERAKRLIIPMIFGTVAFMPILTYLADRSNCGYSGSFFGHYKIFFTKFTDLTGADGGFSLGQFWFLLYLFVVSLLCLGLIRLMSKLSPRNERALPLWAVILLGLPIPFISGLLEVNGKSIVLYTYIFLIGYYVFSKDEVVERIGRYKYIFLSVGIVVGIVNIWLFLWSSGGYETFNSVTNDVTTWFMVLALIGVGKDHLDMSGRISSYMSARSFAFFSLHYIFVVLFQYLFSGVFSGNIVLMFLIPVCISYIFTFMSAEVFVRIPLLSFLAGVKCVTRK